MTEEQLAQVERVTRNLTENIITHMGKLTPADEDPAVQTAVFKTVGGCAMQAAVFWLRECGTAEEDIRKFFDTTMEEAANVR